MVRAKARPALVALPTRRTSIMRQFQRNTQASRAVAVDKVFSAYTVGRREGRLGREIQSRAD